MIKDALASRDRGGASGSPERRSQKQTLVGNTFFPSFARLAGQMIRSANRRLSPTVESLYLTRDANVVSRSARTTFCDTNATI